MKTNIRTFDRGVRLILGWLLTVWAIAGGPWWAFIGLAVLGTAAWRFCPVYALLRALQRGTGST